MIDHAIYAEEVGCFISTKIQRLAEILQDYDAKLQLRFIPPGQRSDVDKSRPYCIVHQIRDEKPYVVMYFDEADAQNPEQILAKIFLGDNWKNGSVEQRLEAMNDAREAFNLKKKQDEQLESADMAHFLMTNRSKNYVNWTDRITGERVKLDSDRRRV